MSFFFNEFLRRTGRTKIGPDRFVAKSPCHRVIARAIGRNHHPSDQIAGNTPAFAQSLTDVETRNSLRADTALRPADREFACLILVA